MYRASEPPDLGPTTLLTNEFVHVRSLPGEQIIEVWRSERPARTLAEVDESWGKVERVLSCVARAHRSLLLDMRQARGRNDPAFESAVAEYRQRTVQGFRRVAVLVSTTAGQLQVQRHIDEEKLKTARVFVDWEEALVWLRQTPSRLP